MITPMRNHSFDLNSTTKIVQSVSITGTILAVSPKWLDVMGYTLEEVLNRPVSFMLEESSLKYLQKNFPHLTKYGFVDNVPFGVLTKEGKSVKFILNGCSKVDAEGNFLHSYCELTPIDALDDNMKLDYFEKERLYKSTVFLKKNIIDIVTKEQTIDGFLESLYTVLQEPVDITDVIIEDKKNQNSSEILIYKNIFEKNSYNGFILQKSEFPKEIKVSENTAFLIFLKIDDSLLESKYRLIIIGIDSYKRVENEWYETFISISQMIELAMGNILIKEQEKMLQQQSRLAQMGEMISMIAHQWRQPLGAISSTSLNLQMQIELDTFNLAEKMDDNSCQVYFQKELKEIDKLVQNLTNTIDDFRYFYKTNKKAVTIKVEDAIEKSLNIIKSSLASDNIEIIKVYNSKEEIELYESEIMQVILNLLKNAQDNFQEKERKEPSIKIITKDRTISICDNGGGISEDILNKIFDPYFTTKNEKNGTGLGLYMSKTIIEEHHNGKLSVQNRDGGVCFTIELGRMPIIDPLIKIAY